MTTQQDVDEFVELTEELVSKVVDCSTARTALLHIKQCMEFSEDFFVPDIVFSWEEFCLTYIPDNVLKDMKRM